MLKPHVLVTGAHRSGTTWVGRTIAQHPRMVYFQEPFNVDDPNREFGSRFDAAFYYVPGTGQAQCIHESFNRFLRSISHPYEVAKHICRAAGPDIKTPLRFCKYLILGVCQPKRVLIKDPFALMSAGWLHHRFALQVICMIRNPLAFAGSLKKANWAFDFHHFKKQTHLMKAYFPRDAEKIQQFCEHPRDIIDQASFLWNILHSVIIRYRETHPDWLFLRHEDLARNPLVGFQKIFEHLGLRMTEEIRAIIAKDTSASNPVETNSPVYMPRNARGSLETWRTRLTAADIERVIHDTKDISASFYHLQGNEFV
jgi:Sulfotransferase domain